MKFKSIVSGLVSAAVLGLAGFGLYHVGMEQGRMHGHGAGEANAQGVASGVGNVDPSSWGIPEGEAATRRHMEAGIKAGDVDPVTGRKILYYHDPMVPGRQFDAPSKSPFMDMMLVPQYAGSTDSDAGTLSISPRIQQNLGIRTGEVVSGDLTREITTVGTIAWNEREQYVVQARAKGFVEKLHVRATLDRVRAGQPLFDVYVPDWIAVQEDYLVLRRMRGDDLDSLIDAARQRMRQAGMNDAQIALVERSGRVQVRITLTAPADGVLTELLAREGSTVMPGMPLARINDLGTVWAHAEVPESQAAELRVGNEISAATPALPGEVFVGRLQTLLPQIDPTTRTIRARMEIDNPDGHLVPGMFVQMRLAGPAGRASLLVPTEALIRTGRRTLVMTVEADRFRPVEVQTGREQDGRTEVLRGLEAGQRIVLSGQFLVDSEASLRGVEARFGTDAAPAAKARTYRTRAELEEMDGDIAVLTHPEIPELAWPTMTMEFQLAPGVVAPVDSGEVMIEFRTRDGDIPELVGMQVPGGGPVGGSR